MKAEKLLLTNLITYTSEDFMPINNIGEFVNLALRLENLDIIPIKNLNFKFSDDIWDFAPLLSEEKQIMMTTRFIFTDIPDDYKKDLKLYIYWTITHDNKRKISIGTLHSQFKYLRAFAQYLKDNYIPSINSIEPVIVSEYIDSLQQRGLAHSTISGHANAIYFLIKYYDNNMTSKDLSPTTSKLKEISDKKNTLAKIDTDTKTQNIPNEYFNKFLSACIKTMNSESLDIRTRGYAAMIVLLSQTGLRRKQLCTLKANAVTKVSILNNTKTAYFLEFFEMKRRSNILLTTTNKTILNELGYNAYKLLEELFKENRKKLQTDYLYCPPFTRKAPADDEVFSKNALKLIVRLGHDIGAVNTSHKYSELNSIKFSDFKKTYDFRDKEVISLYNDDDIICYPTSHQFRVHLCTELYYKNVPLNVIQHYMNHLTEDMTDYYVRREEYSEKEDDFAKSVIRTIVEEDTKPLGAGSDNLMAKIDEFIEKGNFHVVKDIDAITSGLIRKMPIKEKLGGICIKSGPKRDCSKDGQSDELYCAYGICPNHFHLYTMADISYTKCKALCKTMEHNKAHGFIRQSQKEKNKLIFVAEKSLKPELEQLKDKMNDKGSDWIKDRYPQLIPIIDNLDTIEKEVESWLKLK